MPSIGTCLTASHPTSVPPDGQASAPARVRPGRKPSAVQGANPTFAKRHYQRLAAVLARELARVRLAQPVGSPADAVRAVAEALADELARDNSRFDRARFLAACDLD